MMINCSDQDVSSFFGVKDIVGLETKTTMSRRQLIDRLSDAREICEETEGAL
jgi:hypothetical protein